MKALIIGATGATGKDLVDILLQDPEYKEILLFVRRPIGIIHPKLAQIITDFDDLDPISGQIRGDILFSCLGTTLKAAGSRENQRRIDYEIPLRFAAVARKNGVSKTVLLSAYGASPQSRIFYLKVKGELEESIADLVFDQYIIFKPGTLLRKDSERWSERIAAFILNAMNSLGLLRKFRPLSTLILAEKLAKAPIVLGAGRHVIQLEKIFGF